VGPEGERQGYRGAVETARPVAIDPGLRRPDFFLVGAPKCGTTAMAEYLGQHPEIGMCEHKETQYFATDLYPRFGIRNGGPRRTEVDYLKLFEHVQDRRRLGEASVWYLYSSAAPHEIEAFSPEAEIIVMLRNPLEALPSLHSEFVFGGIEPVEDFARALALDEERERAGAPRGFPPRSYRSAARYSEQLGRYLEVFGRDRIHVIIYERFRQRTHDAYRATCEFLGVDGSFTPEIRVVNPNKRARSKGLRTLVLRPPESLRKVLHAATSQRLRRRTGEALVRWNTRFERREPLPDHVRESLRPLVAREIGELRALIGVDVSFWLD
jgi:Sulfotransferase domain